MDIIVEYNWELFIIIEVLSLISIMLFSVFRYFFSKPRLSRIFIFTFLSLLVLEVLLGLYVYSQTGEFSTFLLIITLFVVYACTFGIVDFIRLDRWMRKKIGGLRGVELLSQKDYEIMKRNSNPKYIAKKYRISSLIHLVIFVIVQTIFWSMGTDSFAEMKVYLTDFSWVDEGTAEESPYPNDTLHAIGVIWGIVFIVDLIYSWSYTLFPSK